MTPASQNNENNLIQSFSKSSEETNKEIEKNRLIERSFPAAAAR